jgi:restriction endonuclease S subunit
MVKLSLVAEIVSGYAFRGGLSNLDLGDKHLIRPSDLDNFDEDKLIGYDLNAPMMKLEYFDLLLSNKGRFRAALVNCAGDYVVTSSIFIIRLRTTEIYAPYLVAFLNSRFGQMALNLIARGSNIPALTISALGELQVPELTMAMQHKIAELAQQVADYCYLTDGKIKATEELISQLMRKEK